MPFLFPRLSNTSEHARLSFDDIYRDSPEENRVILRRTARNFAKDAKEYVGQGKSRALAPMRFAIDV